MIFVQTALESMTNYLIRVSFRIISGSTSVYNSPKIATSIRRYWKYFPPAHSSGNNVLNVPNLSLLRMYALTHVLCFRFLYLASDIAMAAPVLH